MKDIAMLSVAFGCEQKLPVSSTKKFTGWLGEFTDLTEQLPANRIQAAVKRGLLLQGYFTIIFGCE